MMMNVKHIYIINKAWCQALLLAAALIVLASATSCQRQDRAAPRRSMYYWQTTLSLDSMQRHFLRRHHITRLYVRYFDVVNDAQGQPRPNATLRVRGDVPGDVEVVPVVFVMPQCLRGDVGRLAARAALRGRRAGIHDEIVLFDLSRRNITQYSPAAFEQMYR